MNLYSLPMEQGLAEFHRQTGAMLLDVRTPAEYGAGRIPGSVNLPLHALDNAYEIIENVDTPLYLYCRSGARSRQAALVLGAMGYTDITNIGGMAAYQGKVEK